MSIERALGGGGTVTVKILVADDTPAILDVLRQILEMEGYEAVTTLDGREVLRWLDAEQPDLLLDIRLPGCDGVEIYRQVKQQETLCQIPFLLMSAYQDIQQMGVQSGADGSLQKPFQMSAALDHRERAQATKSAAVGTHRRRGSATDPDAPMRLHCPCSRRASLPRSD